MASDRVQAFVSSMKLRELRRARDRMIEAYDRMETEAELAADPRAALAALAGGLAALRFGDKAVHPEVANVEVVLGTNDPALVDRWLERLRTVVRQGRARADIIPVFGGLLGEWIRPDRQVHGADPDEVAATVSRMVEPAPPVAGLPSLLDRRVDPTVLARARAFAKARSAAVFDPDHLTTGRPNAEIMTEEGKGDAVSAEMRIGDDGRIDPVALDIASAVRLAWEDVPSWDWPTSGVVVRPVWTRTRFRLRPSLDYVTATLVEAVGDGLSRVLREVSGRARLERLLRFRRLETLKAPQIILENDRRLLDETVDGFGWLGSDTIGEEDSVRQQRLGVRSLSADTSTGYGYDGSDIGTAFSWIRAEIDLRRAHGEPVFVLKTDLTDFYPSVSHALVHDLLVWLDVDPRLVALVGRILSLRLPDGRRTGRGLPLGLGVSQAVGELIVAVLVSEVRAVADVEVVTLVDDLVIVGRSAEAMSAAWAALKRAIEAAGLTIHAEKTGAMAIGAPLPADLPPGPVRWGMLALDGPAFRVDEEALAAFVETTRLRVYGHEALLDRVVAWRDQLWYLWTWLAPTADLGPDHLDAVDAAVRRLSDGMASMLRQEVERRFLGGSGASLPDAWLHWPITAGGVGLPYPAADLVPLRLAARDRERVVMPAPVADPADDPAWGRWFRAQLVAAEAVSPSETPTMEPLVARFLERGARMGQEGRTLSPYWRWVLHTLGPDVLEAYGTFDFVSTDLVPVQLIRATL